MTQAAEDRLQDSGADAGLGVTLEVRGDGVAVVTLDIPGHSQNTLRPGVPEALEDVWASIGADHRVRAVVVRSGKPGSFLAGADLELLHEIRTAAHGAELSRRVQQLLSRVATARVPAVAAIDGACLGGGLELALACRARICSDSPKTVLGLPEVQLGLMPAAGGTQRLPRLVGIGAALDLLLTGRHVRPKAARAMGLVDEVVRPSILFDVAIARALELATGNAPRKRVFKLRDLADPKRAQALLLESNPFGRRLLFGRVREDVRSRTRGNYPAAGRIIDVVEQGAREGLEPGLAAEARGFGELAVSPVAWQLVRLASAVDALKKDRSSSAEPRQVRRVAVLGGGLMGSGIAWVTASKAGLPVRLKEKDPAALARGLGTVAALWSRRVQRKALTREEAELERLRVTGTVDTTGIEHCDIVIEAVLEDLALKHRVLREVEAVARETAIFGSNTSSIPITRIAEASRRPENVIGLHYFSPADKMPLLEIIVTEQTAPWVTATCVELGKRQGKTVIVVRDGVGFYTSRVLAPYMNEAARILTEGVPIEDIDRALEDWGFPIGPIALLDEVGIDIAAKVGPILMEAFGTRMEPAGAMDRLVRDNRLGHKNRRGFYRYDEPKARSKGRRQVDRSVYGLLGVEPSRRMDAQTIADRCALLMVNEAALCLEERILRAPRDGDVGAIFGLGFPPFRGGPFRFVDAQGPDVVVRRLTELAASHGNRFQPAAILVDLATRGRRFHDHP